MPSRELQKFGNDTISHFFENKISIIKYPEVFCKKFTLLVLRDILEDLVGVASMAIIITDNKITNW